jgi:hypothetical protein
MRYARVLVLMTVAALWPATAHAARGWWGWLEELSGPGHFDGPVFSLELKCWKGTEPTPCNRFKRPDATTERNRRLDKYLEVTVGALTSRDRPRFKDLEGTAADSPANHEAVRAYPLTAAVMFRPHRSVDIGPGAGVLLFSGTGVEEHARFVLVPVNLSWKPFLSKDSWHPNAVGRGLSLDVQTEVILKGFTGRDFGDTTTSFRSGREMRFLAGISYDFAER